jgi:hypothetical protein
MEDKGASKAVLGRMIEMFATGDIRAVGDTVADDYLDHQGLGDAEIRGAVGFSDVVRAARRPYARLDVWAEDLLSDRDRAIARIRWHGVLPNGAAIDRETIDIVRVADGLAVEHWGCRLWSRDSEPSS